MVESELPLISVVMPVYQEETTISDIVKRVMKMLNGEDISYEIILVDDCSTDGTVVAINKLMTNKQFPIRLIRHPYNKGNGSAIKTGIKEAMGQHILCMDADGQHRPEDIKKLLPYMNDYELVVGARSS